PTGRAPVDHRQIAIDQPVLVQPDEDVPHRARQTFVEREAKARPVGGSTEAFELIDDLATVFFLPLPHALDEFFAAAVEAREPFGGEVALDHQMRGDAGMVGAWKP